MNTAVFAIDTTIPSIPEEWKTEENINRVGWKVIKHNSLGLAKITFQHSLMYINGRLVTDCIPESWQEKGPLNGLTTGEAIQGLFSPTTEQRVITTKDIMALLSKCVAVPDPVLDFLICYQREASVGGYLQSYLTHSYIRFPSFWGTRYKNKAGDICVRSLFFAGKKDEGEWIWTNNYLHNMQFNFFSPLILGPEDS